MSQFEAGKTYKLSEGPLAFITSVMGAVFAGEAGVFKVVLVDSTHAWSDDVTSPNTTEQFNIPHFMADECTEVPDASILTH